MGRDICLNRFVIFAHRNERTLLNVFPKDHDKTMARLQCTIEGRHYYTLKHCELNQIRISLHCCEKNGKRTSFNLIAWAE